MYDDVIEFTIKELKKANPKYIVPCHFMDGSYKQNNSKCQNSSCNPVYVLNFPLNEKHLLLIKLICKSMPII